MTFLIIIDAEISIHLCQGVSEKKIYPSYPSRQGRFLWPVSGLDSGMGQVGFFQCGWYLFNAVDHSLESWDDGEFLQTQDKMPPFHRIHIFQIPRHCQVFWTPPIDFPDEEEHQGFEH